MIHHPVKIGRLIKAFGKDGQMRINLIPEAVNDVIKAGYILAEVEGQKVPYFIDQYDPELELIKLEEIDGPQKARVLSDVDIFILDKDVHTYYKQKIDNNLLKGYHLFDQEKTFIGIISHVMELPYQILFEIKSGENGEVKLIPFHEDLLIDINQKKKSIQLTIAEGLLDL